MTCTNCGHQRDDHLNGPCFGSADCTCLGDFSGYGRLCTCKPFGDWSGPHYGMCTFRDVTEKPHQTTEEPA